MDHVDGYKTRTIQTLNGELKLNIPQTRNTDFHPECLERGLRSEQALRIAMPEMYIHGVATRKVRDILEKTNGLEVTAMQVIHAVRMLDQNFEKWRNRPLKDPVKYLLLDARYEKVRTDGNVVDSALLIAYGIMEDSHRRIPGVSVEISEAEVHWRHFLESLVECGLYGLRMITRDNHPGLKNARKSVFPPVSWQQCQFHLQQNASAHMPKKFMQGEVHDDIRNIFNMSSKEEAESLLKGTIDKYKSKFFELAQWLENELPEAFTVFSVALDSLNSRSKLRTTNMVEFQNKELKNE